MYYLCNNFQDGTKATTFSNIGHENSYAQQSGTVQLIGLDGKVEPSFLNPNDEDIYLHENYSKITELCSEYFSSCGANSDLVTIGCGASIDVFVVGTFENNEKIIFPFEVDCAGKTLQFTSSFNPTIELDEGVHGEKTNICHRLNYSSSNNLDEMKLEVSSECTLVAEFSREVKQQILKDTIQCMGYKRNMERCLNKRHTSFKYAWCHHHEFQEVELLENPTKCDWWSSNA